MKTDKADKTSIIKNKIKPKKTVSRKLKKNCEKVIARKTTTWNVTGNPIKKRLTQK